MPAAVIALPGDERVVMALARLGVATVTVMGTESVKRRLARGEDPEELAADIEALAVMLARG